MKTKKNRRTIRLQGYDYAQDGWYFITLCVQDFEELLGNITDGIFIPNQYGEIVNACWLETPAIRKEVSLDVFQLMPNHFHAIVVIGDYLKPPMIEDFPDMSNMKATFASPVRTVGAIVRGFKGASTNRIWEIGQTEKKVWQYNYYEHIIRNEKELERIRNYVRNNPIKWQEDKEFFKKLLAKMKKYT